MTTRVPARELLAAAQGRLRTAGIASARVDAELLFAHCLGLSRTRLLLLSDVDLTQAIQFDQLVARRATREPLQHLTGSAPFRHIDLAVGPGVFVPRPETELLVDAVLPILRANDEPIVVDLCAGSGAIGIAIASELPGTRTYALERSPDALPWLRHNAGDSVVVVEGDVRDASVLANLDGQATAVVCNPPYVPDGTPVETEVRRDPAVAVFGGPDGLDLMDAVVRAGARLLRPGGVIAIEHDDSQGRSVPALLERDRRFLDIQDHRDLNRRPRYTTARRR